MATTRSWKETVRRSVPFIGSIVEVDTRRPTVVLTYDDGPEPDGTGAVLESLANAGATATFFVLLSRARKHPSMLQDIVLAGHELALHGVDHRRLTRFAPSEVRRRTSEAKHELEALSGQQIRWFRPPYGAQNFATWRAIRSTGLQPVLWSATTWDAKRISHEERVAHALANCAPGSILLAHDAFAGPDDGVDDGPEPTVDRGALTAELLAAFTDRGFACRCLGDALDDGTAVRSAVFSR